MCITLIIYTHNTLQGFTWEHATSRYTCVWCRWNLWMSFDQHDSFTHFFLDKMAAISRTLSLDTFSLIKSFVFWLQFNWSSPKGPIDNNPLLVQIMAWPPNRWQTIIWTNAYPINWHIYKALGGHELIASCKSRYEFYMWWCWCYKQVSMHGWVITSPRILWDVINWPCYSYLLLAT